MFTKTAPQLDDDGAGGAVTNPLLAKVFLGFQEDSGGMVIMFVMMP